MKKHISVLFLILSFSTLTQVVNEKQEEVELPITIFNTEPHVFYDNKSKKSGLKDAEGNIILEAKYDEIIYDSKLYERQLFAIIKADKKYGVYSLSKKGIIIPPIYKYIENYKTKLENNKLLEQYFFVRNSKDKISVQSYNLVNNEYSTKFSQLTNLLVINDSILAVKNKSKWKISNLYSGNDVISNEFDSIILNRNQINNYATHFIVINRNLFGLMDSNGNELIDANKDSISYKNSFYYVWKNNELSIYNRILTKKVENINFYKSIDDVGNDYTLIKQNGKFGIIQKNLKFLISPRFDTINVDRYSYSDFIAFAKKNDDLHIFKFGHGIDSSLFESTSFHKSILFGYVLRKDNQLGVINSGNNFVMDYANYEDVDRWYDKKELNTFKCKKGDKIYFVSKNNIKDSIVADSIRIANMIFFCCLQEWKSCFSSL